MSRIDDLMAAFCPDGVEFRALGDIAELARGNGMPKSVLTDQGVGAIHYGQIYTRYGAWATTTYSFVAPETASQLVNANPGDIIITNTSENLQDVGKAVAWLGDEQIVTGGHATVIRHDQDPKFLSYWFQSPSFFAQKKALATGTKVIDVSAKQLAKVRVPVPPLEVQQEIARVLDQFTRLESELEAELEAELVARRQQLGHYRSLLLEPEPGDTRATLGELFEMRSGRFIAAAEISPAQDDKHPFPCYGGNGLRGYVTSWNHEGSKVLVGRQGALSGNVHAVAGRFYATEHAVVVTPFPGVAMEHRWTFHALTAINLNQFVSKGAQPGLAVTTLRGVEIRVPPAGVQKRESARLDQLGALVNDLSVGLPAELNARRKQYEYYRDKLLTFEEAPA